MSGWERIGPVDAEVTRPNLTTPTPEPSDFHEHDAAGCLDCSCASAPMNSAPCTCPGTSVPSEVTETTACEREVETWEYAIEGDWLVEVVNKHTCGTGPDGYYGAHEPGCGSIPVANIGPLLDRVRREEGERIAQAIDEEDGSFGVGEGYGGEYDKGVHRGLQDAARIARAASVGPSD